MGVSIAAGHHQGLLGAKYRALRLGIIAMFSFLATSPLWTVEILSTTVDGGSLLAVYSTSNDGGAPGNRVLMESISCVEGR